MTMVKRVLAMTGAVALVASAAVVGLGASSAQAAGQTIEVVNNNDLKGLQVVTVNYSGYSPNGPIAVGVCPTGRKVTGPGDCGRSKNGNSKLTTADASGKGTVQITIPEGPLGNATPPAAKCPPCSMGATNIGNASETATVELNYATPGTTGGKNAIKPKPNVKPKPLVNTGPREAMIYGLIGLGVLQLGFILFVRSSRAAPRRSAH